MAVTYIRYCPAGPGAGARLPGVQVPWKECAVHPPPCPAPVHSSHRPQNRAAGLSTCPFPCREKHRLICVRLCIVLSIQGPGQSWARVPLLLGSARKTLRPQVEALKYWPPQRLPEGCRPCLQRQSSGTSLLMMPRPEPFLGLEMGTQSRYTGVSSTAPALGYALPTAPLLTWKGW